MTRLTRLCRAVGVGIAVTTATLAMTQVAHAAPAPPVVPDAIKVPAGNQVFLLAQGTGVQIYRCNGTAWIFVEPRATLTGKNDQFIGTHFAETAGPTWQATDGSKVTGKVLARDPDPLPPNATNIAQLKLQGTPTPVGGDGGRLGATTFIQRVNTSGGVAPPVSACDAVGKMSEVNYTADYYFWKATGKPSKPGA